MQKLKPVGNIESTERVEVDADDLADSGNNYNQLQVELAERERNAQKFDNQPWPGATSWSFGERVKWGDGPWAGEPDKVLWVDQATGLHCIARRGSIGAWCGYVALPHGHRLHGKGYDEVHEALPDLEVHGGLTFADACQDEGGVGAICHASDDGELAWWLGFDHVHFGDFIDFVGLEMPEAVRASFTGRLGQSREAIIAHAERTYATLAQVKVETEDLARQLNAAAAGSL